MRRKLEMAKPHRGEIFIVKPDTTTKLRRSGIDIPANFDGSESPVSFFMSLLQGFDFGGVGFYKDAAPMEPTGCAAVSKEFYRHRK